MHKIKKGIKKKIKGKKGKHEEDDLFDPEQLEKYRKELEEAKAAKAAAAAEGDSEDPNTAETAESSSSGAKKDEDDEEWQKFKQLTSGIDQVLKKTSGDLDRIKSSSYFQRIPPKPQLIIPTSSAHKSGVTQEEADHAKVGSPEGAGGKKKGPRWIDVESGRQPVGSEDEGEEVSQNQVPEAEPKDEDLDDKEPSSPDVEAIQVEDDLFDTSFVDAIASGDIKLAYIPDSPTEEDDGDDPFDTSAVAHVVKQIEDEERRKKRQVDLGLAVNVLTGKPGSGSAKSPASKDTQKADPTSTTKRARPRPTNLLLLDDGEDAQQLTASSPSSSLSSVPQPSAPEEPETLFDALLASSPPPPADTDDVISLVKALPLSATPAVPAEPSDGLNLNELLNEFDVIKEVPIIPQVPLELILNPEEDLEDEFAALAVESLHKDPHGNTSSPAPDRPPPPTKPPPPHHIAQTPTPVDTEPDPFDTTFVEKLPIGKSELKLVENELLGDCATVSTGAAVADDDDDDFDFDPRAGEVQLLTQEAESSNLPVQKDLLGGSVTDLTATAADPIIPESHGLIETEIHDPFDTSVVEQLLPGKGELKLLEQELLASVQPVVLPTSIVPINAANDDDDDFDPRKDEALGSGERLPQRPPPPKVPQVHPLDLAEPSQEELVKALTPVDSSRAKVVESEIVDPFDTSNVPDIIVPGKVELKLLESELVSSDIPPATSAITSVSSSPSAAAQVSGYDEDEDFNPRASTQEVPVASLVEPVVEPIFDATFDITSKDKPLTPLAAPTNAAEVFEDPFDTSNFIQENILPGKAELKFLEKELLESVEDVKPPNLPQVPQPAPEPPVPTPPEETRAPEPHPLDELDSVVDHVPLRPLTPSHLSEVPNFDDPFDTSIASTIVPGKTELRILEQELASVTISLSDADFDPRTPAVSSQPLIPQAAPPVLPPAEEIDPFDTSAVENVLPGRAELKILEAELL